MAVVIDETKSGKTEGQINQEFREMVIRVLGKEAGDDQLPIRDRIGNIPTGGIVIVPDPGDLEPVRYHERSRDEELMVPTFALRAVESVRKRNAGSEE